MDTMTWLWADRPNPARDATVIATATRGVPGYAYYRHTPDAGWALIAVAADEAQAVTWYAHRVDPQPTTPDVAAWLDEVAATIPVIDPRPYKPWL